MIFGSAVWHCLIQADTERGGHLSSRGLRIEQGARVVRMDKKGGVGIGGVQRVGSAFDKTQDGLMTLKADGESHLPR